MANTKTPHADTLLDKLMSLSADDLQAVIRVAREYSDHVTLKGVTGIKAGDRFMAQIEFALGEVEAKGGEE